VVRTTAEQPGTQDLREFMALDCPDWVNVMALTPADDLVLVQQWRVGTERITLEIPGGVVDPGEPPLLAAQRELAEETGFGSDQWFELGVVEPNPALQNNRCTTFLALDVTKRTDPHPDEGEDLCVVTHPLARVTRLLDSGSITHALVLCALAHLHLRAGGWQRPRPLRS
jgi:ADP-ribose pyrophosphatase